MVDVLSPELAWLEGRCYRLNEPAAEGAAHLLEHDLYENERTYVDMEDDGGDEDFEVTHLDNGRFCTQFHVSQHYFGSVIGKKAVVKRRIESDTRCEIRIPRPGQDGDIVILGPSEANVKAARRRINIIVTATRSKQRPTHFMSIPMNSPSIVDSFNRFREEILKEQCDRGLHESIFIGTEKLHITLGMLCLMDNQERLLASKLLTEARDQIILPLLKSRPLRVHMKGVSYMNDDPHEVDVLYGLVEEADGSSQTLQTLADSLVEHFARAGFGSRDYDRCAKVKLHVTLINTKYRKGLADDEEEDSREKRSPREHFDAARILNKYKDFEFGQKNVNEIHLSQRHAVGPDGYYQPTCVISCLNSGDP